MNKTLKLLFIGNASGCYPIFRRFHVLVVLIGLAVVLLFMGCSKRAAQTKTAQPFNRQDSLHSRSEVFKVNYAKGFQINQENGITRITIFNGAQDRIDTLNYVVLDKDEPLSSTYQNDFVIRRPIKRICVFSTTHIGFLSQLGCDTNIVGVATPEIINAEAVRKRIKRGQIIDVGNTFNPNLEILLEKSPDIIFLTVLPATKFSQYQTLIEAGISVMVIAEWLENSPLGRAEWLKLFAMLTQNEALGLKKFKETEKNYLALKKAVATVKDRPEVMSGLPFKGSWFLPGGKSYMARLFEDAGANYYWKTTNSVGSLNRDIEAVFPVALKAKYWINTGTVTSMDELLALDSRYREFGPVKSGKVFNNNKLLNEHGGNAYWEYGVSRPDKILEDFIQILHPESEIAKRDGSDTLHYYRQIK